MQQQSCTSEDLEALVVTSESWSVDDDGSPAAWLETAYSDGDYVDEYVCRNCGEYFTPSEQYDRAAIAEAWQAAIAHLQNLEATL
jgi:hypothetical protein